MNPFRSKYRNYEIEPDEIFLDSKNIPQFDTHQFEGRIEKPITKRSMLFMGFFFLMVGVVFFWKLGSLQVANGDTYLKRSQDNSLNTEPIFADRGIISDRNGIELAWNTFVEGSDMPDRSYIADTGFAHLLGYVAYPAKDAKGVYWQKEFIGKDGVEKKYNERLKGKNGLKIYETDVRGVIQSENTIDPPVHGDNLVLAADARMQKKLYESIVSLAKDGGFVGGAAVVMDIHTGELLSMTSYPEYSPAVISKGEDRQAINEYVRSKSKVLLNRAVGGLYVPGSIIKPFVAIGVLNEGVIDPSKKILSTGSISLPNPYNPKNPSIFKDWKAHGWVDMRDAIAVSSDVYFYEVGGGFQDQKGIGISNIEKYTKMFGIGEKTNVDIVGELKGTIPNPEWKSRMFKGDPWRVGDTYNTSIGQYGFQTTPVQMVRATAAIASDGRLVTPHVLLGDTEMEKQIKTIDIPAEYFEVVKEGMRQAVTEGTTSIMNLPYAHAAAKSGTAQTGVNNERHNSWVVGFFPYEKPKYAFAVMMESAPKNNALGASRVIKELLEWANTYAPEYLR